MEYHFVHDDSPEDTHLKIHVFDGYRMPAANTKQNSSLKIVSVPLGKVQVVHKTEDTNYKLIKKQI